MTPYPPKTKLKYVFDTSAAIMLFDRCRIRDHLLRFSQDSELCVPIRVMEEYLAGSDEKPDTAAFKRTFRVVKASLETDLLPYFNFDSNSGEIWVVSYALKHPDFCCVIDEEFGRNVCNLLKIKVTGTIGIINEMKNHGFLSNEDLRHIRDMICKSRFYLSKSLLDELDKICGLNK